MELKSVCELIVDCEHKTAPVQETGYPSIRTPNIGRGHFKLEGVNRVSAETYRLWTRRAVPRAGDLIMAREAPVGNVAMIPPGLQLCLGQRTLLIRPDRSKINSAFLSYLLNGPDVQELIYAKVNGATVPHLNMSDVRALELPELPPMPIQERIAGILSAYDELVENGQRRIRILESMARGLYREWFVRFRFPGSKGDPSGPFIPSIPEGCEAIPFERLLVSMTGGDWGAEQPDARHSAQVVIVRGTDFDDLAYGGDLHAPIRYIRPSSLKSRGLRVGDLLVENSVNAKSRCVGTPLLVDGQVLARLGRDAVAASFCKVFRFHDADLAAIAHVHLRYLLEEGRMEYYQNVAANGIGNFQAQKFAKEEHLVLPSDNTVRMGMAAKIAALMQTVSVISTRIQNLRRTRDLMLPRLLSGQIEVEVA